MPEDYFDDASPMANEASAMAREEEGLPEEGDADTAVMPRDFFAAEGKDPEPGDLCTVRVVAVHGDSIEVEYDSSEEPVTEDIDDVPPVAAGGMAGYME